MSRIPNRYLQPKESEAFWSNFAPNEHFVQIYPDEFQFLDSLESFVSAGLLRQEAVIIIATGAHRKAIESRLQAKDISLERYIALDAGEVLSRFMVNDMPDAELFRGVVTDLLLSARSKAVRVRAFGEMVDLLLDGGNFAATIRLEELWHDYCAAEGLCLFCAYPSQRFGPENAKDLLTEICANHSHAYLQ